MDELTSEKIAKALKGAGLSANQRIEIANKAWTNDAVFFPNKSEFLFEWICSTFARPNLKKMNDCCLLQLPYWKLLFDLLKHYHDKVKSDLKQSTPTIQVNLLSSISITLQELYRNDKYNKSQFLSIIYGSLEILFDGTFAYRPAFEHVSSVVEQILFIFTTCDSNEETLHSLALIAQILLKKYDLQLVSAANQKKIFLNIVEKPLPKFLNVRRKMSKDTSNVSQLITDIVCHALFHSDTVLEFTSVLKEVNNNAKQASYVIKLFDTLDTMVKNAKDTDELLDVLDITPVLFSAFLSAFRQKRSTSATQDINRMVEFGFFIYLLRILSNIKDTAIDIYLDILCQLLKQVLELNVYNMRNDDITKYQQSILSEITKDIISYINDPKRYSQGLVLDIVDTLLQIDFSIIENCIEIFWPVMLNCDKNAQASCLKLIKSILKTYSASRQIDTFINDLLTHITKIKSNKLFELLKNPMFSRDFLKEFSTVITKSMPTAQALGIFISFQEQLIELFKSTENTKVALVTVYFVEFTKALRLDQFQTFEAPVLSVFNSFVKPSIDNWIKSKSNDVLLPALQIHSTLADVFFDIYVSKISLEDQEWLASSYIQIFQESIKDDSLMLRIIAVTTVNAIFQHIYYNSILQSSLSVNEAPQLISNVIDFILKDDSWCMNTEWNGSLLDINDENILKLACWKLISDEWFELIIRYIDDSRAEKLVKIVYSSILDDFNSSESATTAQLLNKTLLRSANFYEAECFRNCNIETILNLIIQNFQTKLLDTSSGKVAKLTAEMISTIDVSKPFNFNQNHIVKLANTMEEENEAMEEDTTVVNTADVKKIANLMKLLLLFPNEYYKKNERLQTLYLITLVDIWSVANSNTDLAIQNEVSLMCRSLYLRFMDYFSINSILGLDSRILNWLISFNKQSSNSLEQTTNELDLNVLRKIILNASIKTPEEHSLKYFKDVLNQRTKVLNKDISLTHLNKLINLVNAINLVLANRKSTIEINLNNIIHVTDTISKVSQFVISYLNDTKNTISIILEKDNITNQVLQEYKHTFECMKRVFHLTRLLQEYARIVGPNVDEVISAKELSKTLTALASPFIQFLQCTLLSENKVVLDMTTEFIAAFCSILSRYQQIDMTKHVLASIWFLFSLVYNTGAQESVKVLLNAFAAWIQSLSKEQYDVLIDGFLEQAEEEAANRSNPSKEQHHLVFLILFAQLLEHCEDSEKGRLKKQIPSIIVKLSLIAGKTTSLKYLQQMLKLLIQLTSNQSYHFSEYDISLILSCLSQTVHSTAPERFNGQLTRDTVQTIFADICSVLSNLTSQHKDQLIYMMPPYIALIQSLFHCFKSTNISLVNNRKRKYITSERTIPLFAEFLPLDSNSAHRLARLLTTIPQKANVQLQKKSVHTLQKMTAKYTPSLLIEYFSIQSNPTMSIADPAIKSILAHALYDILDLCSEADRMFVLSCLDGSGKALFKSFYMTWKENHKYTGQ
ncbi:Urb2/Npa2 family-domain-containing protein [Cokeromyces recurvatus]|uniref:Urb2/Npa2 family-domain-containing protein n=1 Tax=Cokeromyces recurvatus TaxID=90255 RepID=UPI002220520E|nr:Urb2/Npa2 family-domain-containing protein [Cokeromyces recurvatus]KAI7907434.1 Urb2/Npa2 family-domain-containing protein [Cokeromyces recurvatus]